ncbi:MAG TPA: LON peptidase substrate-binding domain-containing protein, partial [Gemmataceae bacterium]|nr:LON peptidase substrate-binding domain-containing protein [Gemmataceae bacterium]
MTPEATLAPPSPTVDGPASPAPAGVALPVLPLKNTVLFPSLFLPLAVGRPNSVAAVDAALAGEEKTLVLIAQRTDADEPAIPDGLFSVGTRAVIKRLNRGDEAVEVLVQGLDRVRLVAFDQVEPYLRARVEVLPLPEDVGTEIEALQRAVLELSSSAVELAQPQQGAAGVQQMLASTPDPLRLAFLLTSMLGLDVAKEQAILEAPTRLEALRLVHESLAHEVQVLQLRRQIATQAQTEMSKEQRQYILRQQMRAIQDELGETSAEKEEVADLRRKLDEANLPEEVRKEADRDLSRLERISPQSPDHQVTRTYLELIAELPWQKGTPDVLDLSHARQVLDEDHYDLADVKERILEHLAVLKLNPKAKAPILCFVGPPGVG